WTIVWSGSCRCDFFQHFVTLDQFAKSGVLAVEKCRVAVANKKLAAGRIGIVRTRHREHAARIPLFIKLGRDFVARIARAPGRLFAFIFRERIAALNHKAFDDAMKRGAIVKTLARQFLEILDCLWRNIGPELSYYF